MDKKLIEKVTYIPERQFLSVKFKDGTGYGECGKNAVRTKQHLNDNNVEVFETDTSTGSVTFNTISDGTQLH